MPALGQTTNGVLYAPNELVEGQLHIVGSSTMGQLAALWAEGFQKLHPDAKVTIACDGSETALPELKQQHGGTAAQEGKIVIGLISRPLTEAEQVANTETSQQLLAIMVCRDPVAVIAHPSNPIESLVWDPNEQILLSADFQPLGDCLTSSGTWGAIGLGEDWTDKKVMVCAPQPGHGTRTVLNQWLYGISNGSQAAVPVTSKQRNANLSANPVANSSNSTAKLIEYADRDAMLKAIAAEPTAIGLASLSAGVLDSVKTIPISVTGQAPIAPTQLTIDDETYPLIRPLYLIVNQTLATQRDSLTQEFIRYILSDFGQTDVIKDGFVPLTRSDLLMQTEKLSGEIVR